MSKHTKGPWIFKEGSRERAANSTVYKADEADMLICHVICEDINDLQRAEDIANARLIAAAPELLQALKMFLHIDPRCHRGVVSCGECAACLGNSAVAKATGE